MEFVRSSKLKWALKSVMHWLPAMLAVAMIITESTTTMSADNTSRWLLPIWIHLFGPISAAHWANVHYWLRKSGHFLGYGLVSIAFFHGWRTSLPAHAGIRELWHRASVMALIFTLLVASADEYHQTFLPARQGSPIDVGIDVCGGILAQVLIFALLPLFTRNRAREAAAAD